MNTKMTKPKFKPESWHTVIEDASYIKIVRIVNATGTLIANVFPSKFKPNIINANLMAAAPDMYEALELVCEDCREGGVRNCVACAVGKAKRKAIGESESKACKSCKNCSHVRYAYQTKEPYCIERGVYVNEKTTTCDKFNSLDMIDYSPKESEESK